MIGWLAAAAFGAETVVVLDGAVPPGEPDHFRLPFEVPEGTVEIEVRHDDLSELDILDWGVDDPAGWRGWGGGNTEPAVIGVDEASRSYVPGPIPVGTWSVVVGKAKLVEAEPRYHVEIVLRDTPTLAPGAPRRPFVAPAPLERAARWYAGDLHVHSRESGDAAATLDEIADLARSRGLDFVVITDHNVVTHLDYLVDAQARHPDVLFVPGVEFTTYDGHANVLGASAWIDHRIGFEGATIEAAAAAAHDQGARLSVNHAELDLGDLCIGCAWRHDLDPAEIDAIEVGTGGWEPVGKLFTPAVLSRWEGWLDRGYRIAAVGGSDDHRAGADTGPFASPIGNPTTMVFADELSVAGILDGLARGRTVVKLQEPADPMVSLSFVGDEVRAEVDGGDGAELVWVVDGVAAARVPVAGDAATLSTTIGDATRVRAELWVDGDPRTLTSPLWTEDRGEDPPNTDGSTSCGCGHGPAGGLVPLLVAVGWSRRRAGRRRAAGPRTGQ